MIHAVRIGGIGAALVICPTPQAGHMLSLSPRILLSIAVTPLGFVLFGWAVLVSFLHSAILAGLPRGASMP